MSGSFATALAATARRLPDRTALVWSGRALSYRELDARAGGVARYLGDAGVKAGDRVAIALPNGWPFVVAMLGALKAGATVTPLDPMLTGHERADVVADLAPRLVLEHVDASPAECAVTEPAGAPALVLYTSGSTGRPKGAVLSHRAVEFANRSWADDVMALGPDDVVLAALPLSHSFGLNGALLAPLLAGATVALVERFEPQAVAETLGTERVTVFPGVATMFRRLLELPDFRGASGLRLAVSGAAPCPWELAQAWRERTGVRVVRGYGMTELFRPISYLARDPRDFPDCIGRAVPGVELQVVDDAAHVVPAGAAGELWIRSPAMMDGYLGGGDGGDGPVRDGWFATGDLARIDEGGFVCVVGRKRERILRGGYSVFPAEVEAVLLTHPAVAEAAVTGVPHPELGEEVVAWVVLHDGERTGTDALVAWCRERLAGFKYPRRVSLVEALPRTATGKVQKSKLR